MRRLVALVILPLLFAAVCVMALLPGQQAWQSQQLWRKEAKQLLSEAAKSTARRDALERQIEAVRQSQLRTKFYPAGGAMSPGAVLQGDVDAVLTSVQASSRTLAPIAVSEDTSLLRYGVRVSASLRINQLQDLFNRLAQHQRLLRVEQLTVVAPQMQAPDENPPLAVTMDIYGYALASESAASTVAAMAGETGS